MKKETAARTARLMLCLAVWAFIFSNSMQGGEASSQRSDAVMAMVNRVLAGAGGGPVESWALRKAAHFAEFAALGASLILALRCWLPGLPIRRQFPLAFTTGVVSAVFDETIQLFSQGRSARFSDVLLDSAGVLAGMLAAVLFRQLLRRSSPRA